MVRNKLLGEIMIEMGLASHDLIIDCLNIQTEIHRRGLDPIPIGKLLVKTGHVTLEQLDAALEKQSKYHMPS
ncbi:MAG TPA: hypothetical protein VMX94_12215 [Armatimonadota bacterium]|nr:hypothetical protein [Armatimonadota bacterium]